jgi:hypothetical protein
MLTMVCIVWVDVQMIRFGWVIFGSWRNAVMRLLTNSESLWILRETTCNVNVRVLQCPESAHILPLYHICPSVTPERA